MGMLYQAFHGPTMIFSTLIPMITSRTNPPSMLKPLSMLKPPSMLKPDVPTSLELEDRTLRRTRLFRLEP